VKLVTDCNPGTTLSIAPSRKSKMLPRRDPVLRTQWSALAPLSQEQANQFNQDGQLHDELLNQAESSRWLFQYSQASNFEGSFQRRKKAYSVRKPLPPTNKA
jgi:hypothetical protein